MYTRLRVLDEESDMVLVMLLFNKFIIVVLYNDVV